MRAYTQMLQRVEINDEISEYLSKILQLIDRQNDLINELLDLSKIESDTLEISLETINIQKVISQVVDDFRIKFPKRKIVVSPCTRRQLVGDKVRLYQVMSNLLSNAIKYSPEDVPITIEFSHSKHDVHISVKDNGLGIKKADRKKLFLRYSRIHSGNVQGLGLGLFITKKIVEQLAGNIGFMANKPRGSVFFFTLPLSRKKP